MAFGTLVPAGLQAGPATMTSRIIMPTEIPFSRIDPESDPLKRLDMRLKFECILETFPNARVISDKFG
jgi:hypothetical protein